MMLPTHIVMGLGIATTILLIDPTLLNISLFSSFIGSILPDLDIYKGHRKALHYPKIYTVISVFSGIIAFFILTNVTVGITFLFIGAAIHCQMDKYSSSFEVRPWEKKSDRAVYDHINGEWKKAKRWIRYDGSPEDFLLMITIAIPLILILNNIFRYILVITIIIGTIYTVFRRWLPTIAPVFLSYIPKSLKRYIPEQFKKEYSKTDI